MEKGYFDIGEYMAKVEDTAELEILHPATFQPTGIKIILYSVESDAWHNELHRIRKENAKYNSRRDGVPPSKMDADSLDLLEAVTVNWEGIRENGVELPFSKANARKIYGNPKLAFIRCQVDDFIGNSENFISG